MSFTKVNYGPLNWYITVDSEVHEVESCQTIRTAKKILRSRLGKPLPRNVGYKSQRKGAVGFYESYYGSHDHQKHWWS
jgi:hypothetical protein